MESLRACRAGRSRPLPLRYPILASSAGGPNAAAATTTELKATEATQALAAGRLPETLALSTSSAHAPNTSPTAMPVKTKVVPDVNALQGASRSRSMEALKTCRGLLFQGRRRMRGQLWRERARPPQEDALCRSRSRGQATTKGATPAEWRRRTCHRKRRSPDMLGLDVDRYPGQEIDKYHGGAQQAERGGVAHAAPAHHPIPIGGD